MKLIEKSSAKRSREDSAEDGDETPQTKRQCTFSSKSMSATKLLSLLSEYVVEDMLPLSTAGSPAFKKLIGGVLAIQVPGRKALTVHLDKLFDAMNPKLKDILEKVNFVSTTADVWKACNKGFFGMTAHWIDPNTLQRCKAALSCSRLTGRNTYDVLAERIESVHRQFGLNGKVTATITDNGSNFVKAFKTFSPDTTSMSEEDTQQQHEEDNEVEDEATFEDVCDTLTLEPEDTEFDDYTQVEYELPPHERCAAHTLNLVASSDVDKSLSTSSFSKNVYRSSFAKCTSLWSKASRSTVASDHVEGTLKRKLTVPTSTRWNSYYDAVSRITENSLEEINALCTKLELCCFTDKEYTF